MQHTTKYGNWNGVHSKQHTVKDDDILQHAATRYNRLILTADFPYYSCSWPRNKEMKFQNKGAALVQIAPLFISQPRNQNQSIHWDYDANVKHIATHFYTLHTTAHCNKLQCTATDCDTLQHTATDEQNDAKVKHRKAILHASHNHAHCNTLRHCNTRQIATACCSKMQHTATHSLQHTHCNILQHTTTYCNTMQHSATHCNIMQHTAAHCNTLQPAPPAHEHPGVRRAQLANVPTVGASSACPSTMCVAACCRML